MKPVDLTNLGEELNQRHFSAAGYDSTNAEEKQNDLKFPSFAPQFKDDFAHEDCFD